MTEYEFELVLEAIIVCGMVLLSLAYCISCTRWANEMSRKARAMQKWVEVQRAAEGGRSLGCARDDRDGGAAE